MIKVVGIFLACLWFSQAGASTVLVDRDTQRGIALFVAGQQDKGLEILTLKASEGVAIAQYNLAAAWATLEQTDLARHESLFWLERAALSGYGPAQFALAMLLRDNEEDVTAREQSVYWLTEAAAGGHRKAQYNLAYLAFSDSQSGVSTQAGLDWLSRSATAGDIRARGLLEFLNDNDGAAPSGLYPGDLEIRLQSGKQKFVIAGDSTAVYPIPISRQDPIMYLPADTWIEVIEEEGDWLGIRVPGGVPAWVARDELTISGNIATVHGLEANLYVEPPAGIPVYKLGVVNTGETLEISSTLDNWIEVNSPDYFVAWVRKSAVREQPAGQTATDKATVTQSESPDQAEIDAASGEVQQRSLDQSFAVYNRDSRSADLLGIVSRGRQVEILEQRNGFTRIGWDGGLEAWISGQFLDVDGTTGKISGDRIRVRIMPGTDDDAKVVGSLVRGQVVQVTGVSDDWYRVVIDDRSEGWIENL